MQTLNHQMTRLRDEKQLTLAALLAASLALTACAKQENAPAAEAEASAAVADETVTPEQQAAIDAIDQPVLDEKIPTFLLKLRMLRQMQRLQTIQSQQLRKLWHLN